jgi:hypothetical protein
LDRRDSVFAGFVDSSGRQRYESRITGDTRLGQEDRRLFGVPIGIDPFGNRRELVGRSLRGLAETIDLACRIVGIDTSACRRWRRIDPNPRPAHDARSGGETLQPLHGRTSG